MPTYITTQVFTPTSPARLTFVERQTINNQLVSALKIPGKQVVVYGHTGCGKTTVLTQKLEQLYEDHVTSSCTNTTTFEALLINAFERLETFYSSETTQSTRRKLSATLEAQLGRIKAALGGEGETSEGTKATRLVPPQLTPQTLAQLLGELHKCWVLEDFHKVPPSER
jgi:energy-coupling factor transporter ATP-binding protein EcfA2